MQDARLEVLKRLLVQRDLKQQEMNNKRLDKLWSQKQQNKDEEVEKIRKEHIKSKYPHVDRDLFQTEVPSDQLNNFNTLMELSSSN